MARIHQPAYLYHFTYIGAGEFASLGAFHSEESMFLSKKYWTTWIRQPYDNTLSNAIIGYWVQFAKKGNPNKSTLPAWPAYQANTDLCQELGQRIGAERMPRAERFEAFQQFLNSRLAKSPEQLLGLKTFGQYPPTASIPVPRVAVAPSVYAKIED